MATEVISAWDVYWVLQLDSIGNGFAVIPILGVVATFFVAIVSDGVALYDESKERFRAWPKLAFTVAGLMLLTSIFLPSSKTAAAMIVLPAIANNETIQKEAGELYGLAKEALREAVGGDEDGGPKK